MCTSVQERVAITAPAEGTAVLVAMFLDCETSGLPAPQRTIQRVPGTF